ncbi:ABC transporter ATP-binding protein [Leifsonia sp. EB34]|uniref:ABC transporter ATP-binding protein n=1 Tax=Leifsonia sp. EB34 TaxID=3156303 RepID=UPI00351229F7
MPVTFSGVTHSFDPGSPLFRPISHTFDAGTITGVVGPSGCGKSTLLAIAAGMIRPTAGSVTRPEGRSVWVFQNPHGVARRSALDHVSLPLLAGGRTRRAADEEARRLLADFGLADRAAVPFSALSGGEAQRLMLARAVAARPQLLLVDEPTAQLDRPMAAHVNAVVAGLARSGTAVVIATHDADTRRACDQVLELEGLGSTIPELPQ